MSYVFRVCKDEADHQAYIRFLLANYGDLKLPYPFAMALGFIGSPLLFGQAMLVYHEDTGELIGAMGFVYGTGTNDYQDREICQVEVAYILSQYRCTFLFVAGLNEFVKVARAGNPDVSLVQFWVSEKERRLERLLSKFLALSGSVRTLVNDMTLYAVPLQEFGYKYRRS